MTLRKSRIYTNVRAIAAMPLLIMCLYCTQNKADEAAEEGAQNAAVLMLTIMPDLAATGFKVSCTSTEGWCRNYFTEYGARLCRDEAAVSQTWSAATELCIAANAVGECADAGMTMQVVYYAPQYSADTAAAHCADLSAQSGKVLNFYAAYEAQRFFP